MTGSVHIYMCANGSVCMIDYVYMHTWFVTYGWHVHVCMYLNIFLLVYVY